MNELTRPLWVPSKRHLEYIRSLPWAHTENNLDYKLHLDSDRLYIDGGS
jgi:hypothetical protein